MDKVNILLVDDQPAKLLSYQAILADLDENLVLAKSGREALQYLLKEECALILLDVVMPEIDGFETASMIRERPRLERTPIIFVTAYSTSDLDRLKGYGLGAVDYVFAPIVPEILRAKVAVFVELYRKRLELRKANELLRAEIEEREEAQARLRQSEERFRLMVENVRDYGIFMLDVNGSVATWNAGAARVTGYTSEEIVGQHFSVFYTPEDIQDNKAAMELRVAGAEGRYEEEGWRVRKDGSLFWANVVITALHNDAGELVGFAKLSRDLTERKRAQEQALQTARLAAIGQMVAGLAHESRNALQQIQACIEMLRRRVQGERESTLVGEIQKAHDRLHHLLEHVRQYAAPLKLNCEVSDLAKVWQEAWNQLAPQREGRDVRLNVHANGMDLSCLLDSFPMEQLFRNVFENSLAACSDPVSIDIICTAARHDGKNAVRVCINDNGTGLTDEQKQRIFEPFYTTKTRGTGLGMAIAKRIVEAHGGNIAVGNGVPGTSIVVVLPRGCP